MTDMQSDNQHSCAVYQRIDGFGQNIIDNVGNRLMLVDKADIDEMKQDKGEDGKTGIGHGTGAPGSATGGFLHSIPVVSGRQIVQVEIDTGNNMEQKDGQQAYLCDSNKKAEGMQVFRVAVKGVTAKEDRGVAGRVHKEKTSKHEAGYGHDIFLADRGKTGLLEP